MKKSLLISEQDSIAALLENERVVEFFVNRGELLLGDIYSATVENILPGIDAAFVNLGKDKMGFLHANDVPGQGPLKERLVPKQKLLVQITKEPTGHKGPRVSTAISLPGRFLVLVPEERGVSISRRISEARERSRLKSVVNLMKPPGVGLIIRTEAKGQGENELFDDFEALWDRWQTVVSEGEASIGPTLIYRDQDLLFRVIRDAYSHDVTEIICDTPDGQRRAQEYLHGWAGKQTRVTHHTGDDSLLVVRGVDKEIEAALSDRAELPSGGHLNIQPTEALTVIDVNSGRFTSSRTQAETVRRTNLEAAQEIPRQLRLRNIGGMVIVDFIDMDSRKDQQQVLEVFQRVLEEDRAKPQVGQLSDLGLVELTRRRQGQSLRELFTHHCSTCSGLGVVPTLELGPVDNRRVITFKTKEEEAAGRRGGRGRQIAARQGQVMRAASASNGRVMPTMEEEPTEFDEVPEEILAQMPDELLLDDPRAAGKISTKRGAYSEAPEDLDVAEEHEEVTFEVHNTQNFAPSRGIFEEGFVEEEETKSQTDLEESISEVEQVFQDMGARLRPSQDEAPEVEVVEEPVAAQVHEPVHHPEVEDRSDRKDVRVEPNDDHASVDHEEAISAQEDLVSYAASNPYETELDPITGVWRLKIKPPSADADQHESGDSHDHESHSQHQTVAVHQAVQSGATGETHEPHQSADHWLANVQTDAVFGGRVEQERENAETLADEFENRSESWQAQTQAQIEETKQFEQHQGVHESESQDEETPQPQETHNT